ncbi:hypothetical protein LIER_16097 [Lithospermum erythrorhizon]|uniref:Uncharacterized protein n=1 Tax=Lithospermum erythrorhizon TaxID=34254 RepID=A0AAV3QAQ7_LITER
MGESKEKGVSSSVNSQDSSSLLDFDLKNDFLNSWKPKSGGEANLMDIDFGSPVKSKKKTFGFDKMDMDFNLDSGFGKLSSFNIDLPDLDVSSPLKRDGKHKEKSKDASGKENNKGKADRFDFSFDFMEMDSFNFKSPAKKNKMNVAGEDKNDSPKGEEHQGATIQLTEEIGRLEVGLSEKTTVSGNLSSSNTTMLHGGIDSDLTKDDASHQSIEKVNGSSENMTAENVAVASAGRDHDSPRGKVSTKCIGYDDSTLKTPTAENVTTVSGVSRTSNSNTQHVGGDPNSTSDNISLLSPGNNNSNTKLQEESIINKTLISAIQQTDFQTEKRSNGGEFTQEIGSSNSLREHSVHSTSEADSGEDTGLLQEKDILASNTVLGGEQDDKENVTADSGSRNEKVVLEKSSQQIANAEPQHLTEGHDVNNSMECLEQVQCNYDKKLPPDINMSSQMLLRGRMNEDPTRNFPMPSISRAKVDSAIPASEALISRSKYFTGSSKSASELQKSTVGAPKLTLFGRNSVENTKPSLTAESKPEASIRSQAISSGIPQQAERATSTTSASAKPLLPTTTIVQQAERSTSTTSASAMPLLPTITIVEQAERSTSTTSASAKPLLPTSTIVQQAERSTSTTSPSVKPLLMTSTIAQQADKSTSPTSTNAKPSLPNLIPLKKNTTFEPENIATTKTVRKLTNRSGTENRRTLGNVDSTMNQKEDKSVGIIVSNKRLIGNMPSKISPCATPRQQTFESLKRKTPEAPDSVEMLVNHPKRHSDSSTETRRLLETAGISIDKKKGENLAKHNAEGIIKNLHRSPVQILPELNMPNPGSSYCLNDDKYIEKAEACSKELEDISNMLRKKHEEAKDLLVRAIINNNKLLMLNHPVYDEKISFHI